MRGRSRPVEQADRERPPAFRFHLWQGMVAVLVVAVACWAFTTFGLMVLLPFLLLGLVACAGVVSILPFFVLAAIVAALEALGRLGRKDTSPGAVVSGPPEIKPGA